MFLQENCTLVPLNEALKTALNQFDCNHPDINDFFSNDCFDYEKQLIGKTYCFTLDDNPKEIVCAFTIANDSIKVHNLPGSRKKKVTKLLPREKIIRSYPAVLIGRLGVSKNYQRNNIGSELMDFIKSWFVDNRNKTGCRFIVVDSYNEKIPLDYYKNNGFVPLFFTENQEKKYMNLSEEKELHTRLLYFDLIILRN